MFNKYLLKLNILNSIRKKPIDELQDLDGENRASILFYLVLPCHYIIFVAYIIVKYYRPAARGHGIFIVTMTWGYTLEF